MPGRPTTLAYGREGACCACSRCGTGGLFFFVAVVFCCCFFLFFLLTHLSYLLFLMPHPFWRQLDILKYCGLGRYNPTVHVVVSYYWRRARSVLVDRLVDLSLPRNSVNG